MNKRVLHNIILAAACLLSIWLTASAEEGYPLREKFPKVKYITTEALSRDYQNTIIVDVRSQIEYDVIHISKAVRVPIVTKMFIKQLEKVRDKKSVTPIAFYCNGHNCHKSYEAAEQAMEAGFKNVFAYDAGIYDWVRAHPEKGTLMGESPVPLNKLIPREALAKKKINYDEFKEKAKNPGAIVIDIREPFQRKAIPQIPALRNIPSDRLADLIKTGEFKGKQLLIMDNVGKQVEWIQYYLEVYGYSDYHFLDKGVDGYMKSDE
jgi:rhodanese-related sulfurtransferase